MEHPSALYEHTLLTLILLYAHVVLIRCGSYFGFVEELSEAASRILLGVRRHLQDELHDYSLVRYLLHQCFFLQGTKYNNDFVSVSELMTNH